MKLKKSFAGVAILIALFIGSPQVSAEDVEIFDGEGEPEIEQFDENNEDLGPNLIFNYPDEVKENETASSEETPPSKENSTEPKKSSDNEKDSAFENAPKIEDNPQKVTDDPSEINNPPDEDNSNNEKRKSKDSDKVIVIEDPPSRPTDSKILNPKNINEKVQYKKKHMHTKSPRFVKLMVDEHYTYYLDKQSVSWKRVPYLANEYMLDFWVRLIERDYDNSYLPNDLSEYLNDTDNGEIAVAAEKGIAFAPIDVEVLQHKKFFLEHYYLRPKTKQIQFLCELEVVGHPQNTISEREYDHRNWENLIPGSAEQIIYNGTLKSVSKKGSSEKGRMSFADMMDEYARISIR